MVLYVGFVAWSGASGAEKGLSDLAAHFLTKARNPRVGVFRGCFMRVYLLLWVCGLFGCEQGDRLGAGSHP